MKILFCYRLDNLLGGGLLSSCIYEFCGPSACGKTQLSFSILLNVIISTKRDVIYIDTKNEFSVNRIKKILKNKYLTNQEVAIEKNILIVSPYKINTYLSFADQ